MLPLPHELISLIVHQLTSKQDLYNCTLINKTFHDAANPPLWHTPTIYNDAMARRFITCLRSTPLRSGAGRFVRTLSLRMSPLTDDEFLLVMVHLTHLESLSLVLSNDITESTLQHLPHHCPRLIDLQFTFMPVAQPAMDALGLHCHRLTRLMFFDCKHLGPDTFSSLMPCPLTCLTIEYPGAGLTAKAIKDLASNGFDQLTHLTLGNSNFYNHNKNEFISSLLTLAATPETWPRLTHLTISSYDPKRGAKVYGDGVFATGLVQFLQSHGGRIKHLGLESGKYDDSVLDAIGAIRPPPTRLTSLSLVSSKNVSAGAVRRLVHQWPMLSSVSLGCNQTMTLEKFPEVRNINDIQPFPLGLFTCIDVVTDLDEEATRMIRLNSSHGTSQPNN